MKFKSNTFWNPSNSNPKKVSVSDAMLLFDINSSFVVALGEFPPAPFIRISTDLNLLRTIDLASSSDSFLRTLAATPIISADVMGGKGEK